MRVKLKADFRPGSVEYMPLSEIVDLLKLAANWCKAILGQILPHSYNIDCMQYS